MERVKRLGSLLIAITLLIVMLDIAFQAPAWRALEGLGR